MATLPVRGIRSVATFAALALALLIAADDADARLGRDFYPTSRFIVAAGAATAVDMATALDPALMAKIGQPPNSGGSLGDLFSRPGLLGGFAAGLLGSGPLGLLFGHGLFGELGGTASFFGLMLQLTLLVMLGRLIWSRWFGSHTPRFATLSPRQLADAYVRTRNELLPNIDSPAFAELAITASDYRLFEHLMKRIEAGYRREDIDALRDCVTPQMMDYLCKALAHNAGRGAINIAPEIKLDEGNLAEAWREGDTDYAALTMHSMLVDRTTERESGGLLDAPDTTPTEATETWIFSRAPGHSWLLSAIQRDK